MILNEPTKRTTNARILSIRDIVSIHTFNTCNIVYETQICVIGHKLMYTNTNILVNDPEGFDRHQWTKRAYAFDHVIFASCARRIILQKHFGYGHLVAGTMNPTIKIFKTFLAKVRNAGDAKAYYICMCALYKFLMLIEYPIPPEELNVMLMDNYIYSQENVSVSVKQIKGD